MTVTEEIEIEIDLEETGTGTEIGLETIKPTTE
jgi:hypothetical protein